MDVASLISNNDAAVPPSDPEDDMTPDLSSDEEDIELIEDPSTDIKEDFVSILAEQFEFKGVFAYSKSHMDAPNPFIDINDFGILGLPLNPREAKHLISVCTQAPFGMNERTIVDKTVRDTWELEPTKFRFTNPAWDKWMQSVVVPSVKKAFDVSAPTVVAKIYKLLVYETGSHFLSHQDTEKVPGMFASIVITLPSAFQGASLHLSHAGKTRTFDLAASSGMHTSVLAWYSDVFHAVQPVQSGYRLALSYNLVIPPSSKAPLPSLPDMSPAAEALKHVLLSWRQDTTGTAPTKLVYNLDHQYSIVSMGTASLKGKDAHILEILRPIAQELRFRVYLANLELHEIGCAEDHGYRRKGWGEDEDEDEVAMCEVTESNFTIENVVDLDGNSVKLDGMKIDQDKEMIPAKLQDNEPDDREYEGYMGNGAGSLEYWYRRTALVIYPSKNEIDAANRDPFDYSLDRIKDKMARGWKQQDARSRHVDTVLQLLSLKTVAKTLATLCQCAATSEDLVLWMRAVRSCGVVQHIDRLGMKGFNEGIDLFGFEPLRPLLEQVLSHSPENLQRSNLARSLLVKSRALGDLAFEAWAQSQIDIVQRSLRPPSLPDIPMLFEIAQDRGPTAFLRDIIPQIETLDSSVPFLVALATKIHSERASLPKAEEADLRSAIGRLITMLVARASSVDNLAASLKEATSVISICEEVGAVDQIKPFSLRIQHYFEALDNTSKGAACTHFLLPLLSHVEVVRTRSGRVASDDEAYSPIYTVTEMIFEYGMADKDFGTRLTDLVLCLPRFGNILELKIKLVPHIAQVAKQNCSVLMLLAPALYRARNTLNLTNDADNKVFREIIHHLVAAAAAHTNFNFQATAPSRNSYIYGGRAPLRPYADALSMLEACLSCGAESLSLCERVTVRLQPPSGTNMTNWFIHWFMPFVAELRVLLVKHHHNITAPPVPSLVSTGVWSYISALGKKPREQVPKAKLASIGCGCQYCKVVRTFLLGTEETTVIRENKPYRVHMEKELASAGARTWGLNWATIARGQPQGLQLTKPAHMIALDRWKANADQATQFIKGLGGLDVQQAIFGARLKDAFLSLDAQLPPGIDQPIPASGVGSGTSQQAKVSSSSSTLPAPSLATHATSKRPAPSEPVAPTSKKSKVQANVEVIEISD